jgi:hypothetical protein
LAQTRRKNSVSGARERDVPRVPSAIAPGAHDSSEFGADELVGEQSLEGILRHRSIRRTKHLLLGQLTLAGMVLGSAESMIESERQDLGMAVGSILRL